MNVNSKSGPHPSLHQQSGEVRGRREGAYPVEVLWCGNSRQGNGNGWRFPPAVRKLLLADCAGKSVLHLFGGRSTFGTRIDIDPIVRPDVIADAWLPPFARDSFDIVILDPPYVHLNANMKNALFRNAAWIARERVVWFSTFWVSMTRGLKMERGWCVRVGDNCFMRCLQYFEVLPDKAGPVRYFTRGPQMRYNRWLAQPQGFAFTERLEDSTV